MTAATARVEAEGGVARIALSGRVTIDSVGTLQGQLAAVPGEGPVEVDLAAVEALDTAGAWLIAGLGPEARVTLTGASEPQSRLVASVRETLAAPREPAPGRPAGFVAWLDGFGRSTARETLEVVETVSFFGQTVACIAGLVVRPWRMRWTPLVHHMQATGLEAIPIVALMAFLIGVVIAYQGAVQLRQFGAEVFVVELIAVSILRELGILLTAIIVAGRSGAAFTSAIGSMKMREEVDAMRTLGLDPIEVLVVPRVLALIITLPILGFVAAMAGLIGGALMAWIELGVSPGVFRVRLQEAVGVWNYAIGIIKAPMFALIIGIVGCYQGFGVGGNAELLGRQTSRAVVIAIFAVIVADAVFSIFFALVGV